MNVAHDVYSEMNPAYAAYVLGAFVSSFVAKKPEGPELVTAYISIPLALSGELERAFGGTNKKTGLMEWLGRSPYVQIGLTARLNDSFSVVSDAIRLACFSGVTLVDSQSRLQVGPQKLKQSVRKELSDSSRNSLRRAELLGHWFATAGSSRTIFEAMGLTV